MEPSHVSTRKVDMRSRHAILVLATAIIGLGVWVAVASGPDEPPALSQPTFAARSPLNDAPNSAHGRQAAASESAPALTQEMLMEILRVRRRLGVADSSQPLTSESVAEPSDNEFMDALKRLAGPAAKDPTSSDSVANSSTSSDPAPCSEAAGRRSLAAGDANSDEVAASDQRLVRTLRAAARQLDLRASDLEDDRKFEHAERLRKLARHLRDEAREADSP